MANRRRLLVIYGGQSAEHDVSCVTARHVVEAASTSGNYEIDAIGISRAGAWSRIDTAALLQGATGELPTALPVLGEGVSPSAAITTHASSDAELVVLPLLHGPMGEDGTVQGLLELAGVPYVGTGVLGSAVCMDKAMAKQATAAAGIAQARYQVVHADDIVEETAPALIATLGQTLFVKPANMGSSVGVSRAVGEESLVAALAEAARYDEWVVIEEAIVGREIELGVLGNRHHEVSVPGEIVPGDEFYSYDDKYHDGVAEGIIPADLTPEQTTEVQELARRAASALRVQGLARVDFFLEENGRGFLLNEINTMPGFTPISMFPKMWAASGLSYPDLIDRLVDLAVERHQQRQRHRSVDR